MRKKIHRVLTGMKGHYLNPKQERFVQEYCISLNATDAARKAGYSPKSANRFCIELLSKTHVQDAIQFKRKELATQSNITCLRVLQEYASVGFSDIGNIVERDPDTQSISLRDLEGMAPHIRASIASVSCDESSLQMPGEGGLRTTTKMKVTLHSKLDALNSIVKMLGFDKVQFEKELAAQATQATKGQGEPLDPKTFTNDEWELFEKINARKLKELGLSLEGEVHHEEPSQSPFEIRASYAKSPSRKKVRATPYKV